MTRRRATGQGYDPEPLCFDDVEIPADLETLIETLAEFNHDAWARARLESGWRHGPRRDDEARLHPCLVPYTELSEEEKDIDRNTARAVVRAVLGFGFRISKP